MHRLLTLGPDNEPLWVRLYIQPIGEQCAAMIVADDMEPLMLGVLGGTGFAGDTLAEAKGLAPECPVKHSQARPPRRRPLDKGGSGTQALPCGMR